MTTIFSSIKLTLMTPFFKKIHKEVKQICMIFFIAVALNLSGQISPGENTSIHYTNVRFQEELKDNGEKYIIEINPGKTFSSDTSDRIKSSNVIPVFFINDLQWNTKYFWQVKAYNKLNECISSSEIHSFIIQSVSTNDFTNVHVKVNTSDKSKHKDDLISMDNTRSIFDRTGKAVWSMPMIAGVVDRSSQVRDIKITSNNSITFLTDKNIFEIDFYGNVLWHGPEPCLKGNDTIKFHHAFTKDEKGNYWVIGNYKTYRKVTGKINEKVLPFVEGIITTDSGVYRKIEMDVLLKLNRDKKITWYWDANSYLKDEDINYKKNADSIPEFSVHSNAFSVNKQGTFAYLGMRDMSRVVKIDIKTKKVVASFGAKLPSGEARLAVNAFKSQHDAGVTNHNSIIILNNNTRGSEPSSVMELKDNIKPGEDPVIWKFNLDFDTLTNGRSLKGGNVVELDNGNLLVCAGALNRVFEVTKAKEVVWDAFVTSKSKSDTLWRPMPQYRCNTFSSLVFNGVLVKISKVNRVGNKLNATCDIVNSGNVNDSYKLEVKNSEGKIVYLFKTPLLAPGKTLKVTLSLPHNSSGLLLKATSESNQFIFSRQPLADQ